MVKIFVVAGRWLEDLYWANDFWKFEELGGVGLGDLCLFGVFWVGMWGGGLGFWYRSVLEWGYLRWMVRDAILAVSDGRKWNKAENWSSGMFLSKVTSFWSLWEDFMER